MSQLLGNALTAEVAWAEWPETTIRTGARFMDTIAPGVAVDVWAAEPGQIGGTTTDEIFVVVEGKAEVTFADTGETLVVGPGDVVRLFAGQQNSWRTIEPLRKVSFYVPPVPPES